MSETHNHIALWNRTYTWEIDILVGWQLPCRRDHDFKYSNIIQGGGHLVEDLGWVDNDLECTAIL